MLLLFMCKHGPNIHMNKIIAIDGPAASGKGTLAKNLASALNFAHMDTGALYRGVAYEVLKVQGDPANLEDALAGCERLSNKINVEANMAEVLGNPGLRTDLVGESASHVAVLQEVRDRLQELQRDFANEPPGGAEGAVLDGRDIGTVICPDAPLKLFITADLEIRAERRLKELQSTGLDVTYEAVLEDMRARDARDSGREVSPLRPAEDAVEIDSSDLDAGEMLELALQHAKKAFG